MWDRHEKDGQVEDDIQTRMGKRLGFYIHASPMVLVVPSVPCIGKWLAVVEYADDEGDKDEHHDDNQEVYLLAKPLVGKDSEVKQEDRDFRDGGFDNVGHLGDIK